MLARKIRKLVGLAGCHSTPVGATALSRIVCHFRSLLRIERAKTMEVAPANRRFVRTAQVACRSIPSPRRSGASANGDSSSDSCRDGE
jgi:hypothetical protein